MSKKSVLFVGHGYYNAWFLSRELRQIGWRADLININSSADSQFYHGDDIQFKYTRNDLKYRLDTYINALQDYQIFHFSNRGGIYFLNETVNAANFRRARRSINWLLRKLIAIIQPRDLDVNSFIKTLRRWRLINGGQSNLRFTRFGVFTFRHFLVQLLSADYTEHWDIYLLKALKKKITYANNGCLDGALQSSFAKWKPLNTCSICNWYTRPDVCSDESNRAWGEFRNSIADVQFTIGGNRVDFNDVDEVFEMPWFYCLDKHFWHPDLLIPSNYLLGLPTETVKLYHAVGNYETRSAANSRNIKCTHIYLDVVRKYKQEGIDVEIIFFHDVPNKEIRYYQAQADIFVDMLTFGFFGAGVREAMMLGKPAICYLRPEWLESMRREIPEYVDELPVISATPDTIYEVLKELILNKEKRMEIGRRSRQFAEKWHSSDRAAQYFDRFYSLLIDGELTRVAKIDIKP